MTFYLLRFPLASISTTTELKDRNTCLDYPQDILQHVLVTEWSRTLTKHNLFLAPMLYLGRCSFSYSLLLYSPKYYQFAPDRSTLIFLYLYPMPGDCLC